MLSVIYGDKEIIIMVEDTIMQGKILPEVADNQKIVDMQEVDVQGVKTYDSDVQN